MTGMLLRWLVLAIAVWAAEYLVPGIENTGGWQTLLITALVLGLLNAFVKPLLMLFALPFIVLTLGLFLVVINALLLVMTAAFVPGFEVTGFWSAVGGSLIISLVNVFLGGNLTVQGGADVEREADVRRRPPPGSGPVIDI